MNFITNPLYTRQRNIYENKTNNFLPSKHFDGKKHRNNQYRKYSTEVNTHDDDDNTKKECASYQRRKSHSTCLSSLSSFIADDAKNISSKNAHYTSKSNRWNSIETADTFAPPKISTSSLLPSTAAATSTKNPEKGNINEISLFRYENAVDCISKLNQPLLLLSLNCSNVNKFNERLLLDKYPHQHYYYLYHRHRQQQYLPINEQQQQPRRQYLEKSSLSSFCISN